MFPARFASNGFLPTDSMVITAQHITEAHERIKPFIHKTPVLTSNTLNNLTGAELFFKCENLQKIGAFKIRGGMNAVLSMPKEKQQKGIATHSSGNHAQAIAYAARQVGTKAYIVMPDNSPKVKVDAVRGYGAEIFFCLSAKVSTATAFCKNVFKLFGERNKQLGEYSEVMKCKCLMQKCVRSYFCFAIPEKR